MNTPPSTTNPFKGKRAFFRAAAEAKADLEKYKQRTERLIESWKQHGGSSGISLHAEPRNHRIRWRATMKQFNHQRMLDFDSEEIVEIRSMLSVEALTLLLGFEHRRLTLNANIAITTTSIREYESYIERARALEKIAPANLQTPLIETPEN